jgi:hypothetical protein
MFRSRLLNVLVVLAFVAGLWIPGAVLAQTPEPVQPSTALPVMQTVSAGEAHNITPQGGSWLGSNLIVNGDAEATIGRPPAPWQGGETDFIVASSYGDPGYPYPNDPGPVARGARFFRASKQNKEINAWQKRDVSAVASAIDTGQIGFQMSGFFGGLGSSTDYALLRVYFEDANQKMVAGSSPVAIGFVSAADRLNRTGLLERSTLGKVPKGTRFVNFQLQILPVNRSDPNARPDALADNLSFNLQPLKTMLPMVTSGITQPARSVPAAPSSLTATGDSLTTLRLAWTDNAANETGYLVERAPAGSSTFAVLARIAANQVQFSDKGLSPQTSYTYRVSAYNEVGASPAVTASGATLANPLTPPAAPASCWTSSTSAISTVVGWSDSSDNEEYFTLQMMYEGQSWVTLANIEPGATYVIVTDLLDDKGMYFRIRAHNEAGDSAWCTTAYTHTTAMVNVFTVENYASYPIVYLEVDGVNQLPVYPMGIFPGGAYQMSLPAGHHEVEVRTGFWQSRTDRFDMYSYFADFDLASGGAVTLEVPDVSLEGILTQFDPSGMGYWEGYYFDANMNCRTVAFQFDDHGGYQFYTSNVKQGSGQLCTAGPPARHLQPEVQRGRGMRVCCWSSTGSST